MIPRGRLDIDFLSLFKGIGFCIADIFSSRTKVKDNENTLHCLSVRTGLDLTLRSLDLVPESEILVTNINIPDMFSIVSAHGLVAVPLSLNKHTLGLFTTQVEALITPHTKAILITHLFGAIMDIGAVIKLARYHNLIVIEDCAQAYNGAYNGHPETDVVMFSFGLIKTNTSLTGAMLRFSNTGLCSKVKLLNAELPVQSAKMYLKKLFKAIAIQIMTLRLPYTLLYYYSRLAGKDFDDVLAGFTRGFPGADVMAKIRFRPCQANLRMMRARKRNFSLNNIVKRKNVASGITKIVPDAMKIGCLNTEHTYWVLPIERKNPGELIEILRNKGVDATAKASSLVKLGKLPTIEDELVLDDLVYLPISNELTDKLSGFNFSIFDHQ